MIDPFKPVRFLDDRSKEQPLFMGKLVFLSNSICLCTAYPEGVSAPAIPRVDDYVLFDLATGRVLTDTYAPSVFIAENF